MKLDWLRRAIAVIVLAAGASSAAKAQSVWDSVLQNSQWSVPSEDMLAYAASGADLTSLQPIADQTIWTITDCTNGVFTGTSVATFKIGPTTLPDSTTTMNGFVTEGGQVRIAFSQTDGPTTIGIGQMRTSGSETTLVEMQMITGNGGPDGIYVTHWAYMELYDGNPATLPPLEVGSFVQSAQWDWLTGSSWGFSNPDLFGADGSGTFAIEGYHNGYFWGTGTGTAGSAAESYTLLGSATPEGNLLFSILSNGVLTSLTGEIAGDASDGHMVLRSYDPEAGLGAVGYAQTIPEPSTLFLPLIVGAAVLWKRTRFAIASRHPAVCPKQRSAYHK